MVVLPVLFGMIGFVIWIASALAKSGPLLLAKSDPHSEQDLGAEPTEGLTSWKGVPGARQTVMGAKCEAFGAQSLTSCAGRTGQGSPKVTSTASLPLTGPSGAAIRGPLFPSKPGSIPASAEGIVVNGWQRRQQLKLLTDFNSRLLDRIGSTKDFSDFLQTEGGAKLVDTLTAERGSTGPCERILRATQGASSSSCSAWILLPRLAAHLQ